MAAISARVMGEPRRRKASRVAQKGLVWKITMQIDMGRWDRAVTTSTRPVIVGNALRKTDPLCSKGKLAKGRV